VPYDVPTIYSWDFSNGRAIMRTMDDKAPFVYDAAKESNTTFDVASPYWTGEAGDAARNLSHMHFGDVNATVNVIYDLTEEAGRTFSELEGWRDKLRNLVDDAHSRGLFLRVADDGTVRTTRSDDDWRKEWHDDADAKLKDLRNLEQAFTEDIKNVLLETETADRYGSERINSVLERLADGVKEGAQKLPRDPRLAQIMKDYQTDESKGRTLFPPNWMIRQSGKNVRQEMLTDSEIRQIMKLGRLSRIMEFVALKSEAVETARKAYKGDFDPSNPSQAKDSGYADAFRHAYWNAMMTKKFGAEWTKEYATRHESIGGNSPAREAMDLYNNELGRRIAAENPNATPEQLQEKVKASISKGEAIVVSPDRQTITWTNADHSNRLQVPNGNQKLTGVPWVTDIPLPGK